MALGAWRLVSGCAARRRDFCRYPRGDRLLRGFVACAVFLAAAALRLLSVAFAPREPDQAVRVADHELPIYTIICPLYREASVVGNLVAALRALDYPAEKLNVKLVIEADDHETRRAIAQLKLGPPSRSSPHLHSGREPSRRPSTSRCRLHAARSP